MADEKKVRIPLTNSITRGQASPKEKPKMQAEKKSTQEKRVSIPISNSMSKHTKVSGNKYSDRSKVKYRDYGLDPRNKKKELRESLYSKPGVKAAAQKIKNRRANEPTEKKREANKKQNANDFELRKKFVNAVAAEGKKVKQKSVKVGDTLYKPLRKSQPSKTLIRGDVFEKAETGKEKKPLSSTSHEPIRVPSSDLPDSLRVNTTRREPPKKDPQSSVDTRPATRVKVKEDRQKTEQKESVHSQRTKRVTQERQSEKSKTLPKIGTIPSFEVDNSISETKKQSNVPSGKTRNRVEPVKEKTEPKTEFLSPSPSVSPNEKNKKRVSGKIRPVPNTPAIPVRVSGKKEKKNPIAGRYVKAKVEKKEKPETEIKNKELKTDKPKQLTKAELAERYNKKSSPVKAGIKKPIAVPSEEAPAPQEKKTAHSRPKPSRPQFRKKIATENLPSGDKFEKREGEITSDDPLPNLPDDLEKNLLKPLETSLKKKTNSGKGKSKKQTTSRKKTAVPKKRGRPLGSKNKNPKKKK